LQAAREAHCKYFCNRLARDLIYLALNSAVANFKQHQQEARMQIIYIPIANEVQSFNKRRVSRECDRIVSFERVQAIAWCRERAGQAEQTCFARAI
jgi:N-dimethylarginine dimethylaminohydrolase